MTTFSASPAGGERLHALDAIRGGALLLGVAFHATMSFLPGPQIWVVRDAADPGLGGVFFWSHMFRMILFFLIAGFFGRMLVERRGTRGFVRDRFRRILLPLLLFWLPVMAGIVAMFVWGAAAMNGGTMPSQPAPPPAIGLATFPLTHLWFLYVLTLFYLAALVLRRIGGAWLHRGMRILVRRHAVLVPLALPLAAALAAKPDWIPSLGIPTPDIGFVPNLAATIAYGIAFGFGWLLNRQSDLLQVFARSWPAYLGIALGATAILVALLGAELPVFAPEADPTRRSWLASLYALAAPPLVKFALVLGSAFLILFASYHLLVRHSWLGRWLNGRKYPWRAAKPAMEAMPA